MAPPLRVHLLGTGTGLPDPTRGPAGFALQVHDHHWLWDLGSGSVQRAARAGLRLPQLQGLVLSHRHADHCADLAPLLFARTLHGGLPPLPLWGGEGLAAHLDLLQQTWGRSLGGEDRPRVHLTELPLDRVCSTPLADGLNLTTAPANHKRGALHLAAQRGAVRVVFSGDTGPSEHLVHLATGVDLLICECGSDRRRPVPGHLTADDVAELVDAARPHQVLLTHLYRRTDPAEAVATVAATGVPVAHAFDGQVWEPEARP